MGKSVRWLYGAKCLEQVSLEDIWPPRCHRCWLPQSQSFAIPPWSHPPPCIDTICSLGQQLKGGCEPQFNRRRASPLGTGRPTIHPIPLILHTSPAETIVQYEIYAAHIWKDLCGVSHCSCNIVIFVRVGLNPSGGEAPITLDRNQLWQDSMPSPFLSVICLNQSHLPYIHILIYIYKYMYIYIYVCVCVSGAMTPVLSVLS